ELSWRGDGVEDPRSLAGPNVVAADEARDEILRRSKRLERRTDHHDIAHDDRGRVQADLAFFGNRSIQPLVEVDDAVLAEAWHRPAGLCVEGNQMITRRDMEDALLAAVGPEGHAAARRRTDWRLLSAHPFVEAEHPQRFARGAVDGHYVAPRARGGVQNPSNHQRRDLIVVVRPRPEVLRLPAPGDPEVLDVVLVDLIERR